MSSKTRSNDSTAQNQPAGTEPSFQSPRQFTDWNGGKAVANESGTRRDDLVERPTMEMDKTINRTKLRPEEGTPPSQSVTICGKSLFERLALHNRDLWRKYRDDVDTSANVDREYKRHLLSAFAGEVGTNVPQTQRAFRRFMELDLPNTGVSNEINALVICTVVVNRDAEAYGNAKAYHPQRAPDGNHSGFQRLADSLSSRFPRINAESITSIYNKHRQGKLRTHPANK